MGKSIGHIISGPLRQEANLREVRWHEGRSRSRVMRGLMQEDHRFYKEHGLYDFPQKQTKRILQMKLIGLLFKPPRARKEMGGRMKAEMVKPYADIIAKY